MCCDYVPMAGAALCYSEGRGFEPHRGTTPASAPVWAETFFMAGRHSAGAHSPPLQIGAKSSTLRQNSVVMMESSSAVQLT
ncbi:conserved domain protein [Actinomyces sp. oral taxon 170 str. F0386]|nr:conserved domain protein [Actinomyces sp. oral taxon 170 str. F0386]